jgi:hypothetical protein
VQPRGADQQVAKVAEIVKSHDLRMTTSYVVDRVVYVKATDAGKGVTEKRFGDAASKKEIEELWNELDQAGKVVNLREKLNVRTN